MDKMNNWVDIIKTVSTGHQPGKCPKCGSGNTNYEYTIIEKTDGFLKVWCNDCDAKVVVDCTVPEQAMALAG